MESQSIPCPLCQTKIPFNAQLLLEGKNFTCPNKDCGTKISLPKESMDPMAKAMEQFEALKKGSLDNRN